MRKEYDFSESVKNSYLDKGEAMRAKCRAHRP